MKTHAVLWLAIAPALALIFYWQGLTAWFAQDDFAWLNMARKVEAGAPLKTALFVPKAQGTIRVISERLYFLAVHRLFGAEAFAFRAVAFLTLFAGLALLAWIAAQITKSLAAGVLAAVFWLVSPGLGVPLAWSSAYNQLLCAVCVLAAFGLWMRYVETGQSRFYRWQWLPYLIGFGVLEIVVVYPLLAAGYAAARGQVRRLSKHILSLFGPAAAFIAFHFLLVPKTDKLYALHIDASILRGLYNYVKWALGGSRIALFHPTPFWAWFGRISTWTLALAIIAYLMWCLYRRRWLPIFFAFWFGMTLAPVLPLRDHRTDYYLAVPAIGLAMLIACAVFSTKGACRVAAIALSVVYAGPSLVVTRGIMNFRRGLSEQARLVVLGAARVQELHPGRVILLKDVSSDAFYTTMLDNAFDYFGARSVSLAPGEDARLQIRGELGDIGQYVMSQDAARRAVETYDAVVFSCAGGKLTNVTSEWARQASSGDPNAARRFVDVGNPVTAGMLGPEWFGIEGRARWMPRAATVRMAGPANAGQRLYIRGYAVPAQLADGPLPVEVSVDGRTAGRGAITTAEEPFDFNFELPASAVGKDTIVIRVEAGRTFIASNDPRGLGLLFGTFTIR